MIIGFTPTGWEDYEFWQQNGQDNIEKINKLIKDIQREPFKGIGKPEALRGNLAVFWSRRITAGHRLVYKVEVSKSHQVLTIIQCRFHY